MFKIKFISYYIVGFVMICASLWIWMLNVQDEISFGGNPFSSSKIDIEFAKNQKILIQKQSIGKRYRLAVCSKDGAKLVFFETEGRIQKIIVNRNEGLILFSVWKPFLTGSEIWQYRIGEKISQMIYENDEELIVLEKYAEEGHAILGRSAKISRTNSLFVGNTFGDFHKGKYFTEQKKWVLQ